ncbi:RNase P and RNase MRP subunit [Didymosphaeria variabile]|uniref:RNase P and RNase MRP subunit n=1 Tax=Didymosphaeria variabile TaxID=1932322 RepID=A0A9W8XQP2_9PLEO|nr:RNase P and RNase MRP subunit [Didymosphaeria variabile]KAJ4355806.1 RNase P and RNase MRP subunit [Didymosphaeria variabile]
MATTARKGSKPIFRTARPYTETEWPALTSVQRRNIMDLLCSLLQPLGDHRRAHIRPSKGTKRKREARKDAQSEQPANPPPPHPPEIQTHILIGLNSVIRHLESLAAQNAPPTAPSHGEETLSPRVKASDAGAPRPLALVLIPHNHPPASLPHANIPTLVHLSTMDSPPEKATRLLAVPPGCEPVIAEALHIPHVGALGILEGAPGADALVAYVRENVDVTRCRWIDEAMGPEWKGIKVDTQQA